MRENVSSCYRVTAHYETGDSFGTENRSEEVGLYKDRSIAEENIKRIEEHYAMYGHRRTRTPPNVEGFEARALAQFSVLLLNSKREEYRIACPWIGYFEALHDLELTEVSEPI